MEHRGHLYLPGCVPHTPQSLGSGFFGGDDGLASEPDPGFATGSPSRGAVRSGETAPSIVDCSAGLPSSAAGMAQIPWVPCWSSIVTLLRLIKRESARWLKNSFRLGHDVESWLHAIGKRKLGDWSNRQLPEPSAARRCDNGGSGIPLRQSRAAFCG